MFDMRLSRTPLFLELRSRIVTDGKQDDILILVAWLLSNFTDDGTKPFSECKPTKDDRPRRCNVLACSRAVR